VITLPVIENATLQISIIVRQRAWVKVMVDGEVSFQGRVVPGSVHSFAGDKRIEVLTGNGAALQVYFNQADLGILGTLGEVVYLVFTVEGVQTPTATITPTAQPTLTPTSTPTATRSP
jgi:hypothetical protein